MALPAIQIIPLLINLFKGILGAAAKKGAQKIVEKGVTETAKTGFGRLLQKGVQGAAKVVAGKQGDKTGVGELVDLVGSVKLGDDRGKKAAKNILMGEPLKNLNVKKDVSFTPAESTLEKLSPTFERQDIVGAPAVKGGLGKLGDIVNNITPQQAKGQKIADTVNKVLFGEGFGSNVLRRTMAGAARQGIFSGSDVGQPDKDVWGILGNSALGAVAGASMDTMQQQFNYQQDVRRMMSDFNPADEAFKGVQPVMHEKINSFKDYIVGVGMNKKGLQKGKFNSRDMLDIGDKYMQLKKEMGEYEYGDKIYRDAYAKFREDQMSDNPKYDSTDFRLASEYWLTKNKVPDTPFLTPAEVDPKVYFPNKKYTAGNQWMPTNEAAPYEMQSPLSSDDKKRLAGTDFVMHEGVRKYIMRHDVPRWKQQHANDESLMKSFLNPDGSFNDLDFAQFMTEYEYGPMVEQNKIDWDKKARYMEQQSDKVKKTSDELKAEEEKRGYYMTENYPYDNKQSGPAIVFKKNYAENVPSQLLQDATGTKISTDDDVVPVMFEYVDKTGNLVVTATTNEAGTQRRRRLSIPTNKSKGLLESYFPGITNDPKTGQMFAPPKNEQPVGVEKLYKLENAGSFTYKQLKEAGWSDDDIAKLQQ